MGHHNDLPRLPDPLADAAVPGPDDPKAAALLKEILMSNPESLPWYRRRSATLLAAAAVLAVVAAGALALLPLGGSTPTAAAATLEAIDNTASVTSGVIHRERTISAGSSTQSTEATIRFDGDDIHQTNRNEGSVIDDVEGQFTPDVMEVITVDGSSFIRLEPMQPTWVPTEPATSAPPDGEHR